MLSLLFSLMIFALTPTAVPSLTGSAAVAAGPVKPPPPPPPPPRPCYCQPIPGKSPPRATAHGISVSV